MQVVLLEKRCKVILLPPPQMALISSTSGHRLLSLARIESKSASAWPIPVKIWPKLVGIRPTPVERWLAADIDLVDSGPVEAGVVSKMLTNAFELCAYCWQRSFTCEHSAHNCLSIVSNLLATQRQL